MAQLRPRISEIRARGAELYAIGNGTAAHVAWFVEDMAPIDYPVWTDPTLVVYRAAGLKHGLLRTIGPKPTTNYARGLLRGFANKGGLMGDGQQQGGAMIVRADGTVPFVHVAEVLGEHVDASAMIAAIT